MKEKITEAAEKIYDLAKDGKYDVEVNLFSKKKKGISILSSRQTMHTKKWRAKNH